MKLLSIDVGIKNLAYCLFDNSTILLWDVINLCGSVPNCTYQVCKKKAKFTISNANANANANAIQNFCPTHAKKSTCIIPTANISHKKIKKMKLVDLQKVIQDYQIPLEASMTKKEDILKTVSQWMEKNMLQPVNAVAANDLDLIQIGVAMRDAFNKELVDHLATIDEIVIENQISPIANRMKTLQGMIAQYFIMHEKTKISFVSASNKLKVGGKPPTTPLLGDTPPHPLLDKNSKEHIVEISHEGGVACVAGGTGPQGVVGVKPLGTGPQGYAARKKEGIKITQSLITEKHSQWLPHFNQHKKKDDLADAFLQGNWYLNKK
jgi:hypothetical protein